MKRFECPVITVTLVPTGGYASCRVTQATQVERQRSDRAVHWVGLLDQQTYHAGTESSIL